VHWQKIVGESARPATRPLTDWDRVRRELHGEKVETDKPRDTDDTSVAEAVLKVLAENGRHFTHLPENEQITVAITLPQGQSCLQCHVRPDGKGGLKGGMGSMGPLGGLVGPGGGGMMLPGMGRTAPPGGGTPMIPPGGDEPGGLSPPGGGGGAAGPGIGPGGGVAPTGGAEAGSQEAGGGAAPPTDPRIAQHRADARKQGLLADLHLKQREFQKAVLAYEKALEFQQKAAELQRRIERDGQGLPRFPPPRDLAAEVETMELLTRLAQAYLGQGKSDLAIKTIQKIGEQTQRMANVPPPASAGRVKRPVPLPARLIVSAPKKVLEQVGAGKMRFEDFRKAATVQYLNFDPPAEKPAGGTPGSSGNKPE
jgi:hypothetical protein